MVRRGGEAARRRRGGGGGGGRGGDSREGLVVVARCAKTVSDTAKHGEAPANARALANHPPGGVCTTEGVFWLAGVPWRAFFGGVCTKPLTRRVVHTPPEGDSRARELARASPTRHNCSLPPSLLPAKLFPKHAPRAALPPALALVDQWQRQLTAVREEARTSRRGRYAGSRKLLRTHASRGRPRSSSTTVPRCARTPT